MTPGLVVLCFAAFGISASLVSLLCRGALHWLDRLAPRVAPRHRVRLWSGVLVAPAMVGLLAVAISFLPALGIGHDHCLSHAPHHPHLCPHHVSGVPGIALVVLTAVVVLRAVKVLVAFMHGVLLCRATARALTSTSEDHEGIVVLPSEQMQAFVLGTLRPKIYISQGILSFDSEIVEAVLAHERAHVTHRDLLWRTLGPVFAIGHLPGVSAALLDRVALAQELAADAEAAASVRWGRLGVAEAIVALARRATGAAVGLSFTDGDLKTRVRALLDDTSGPSPWPLRLLSLGALALPLLFGVAHDLIHHSLETLLGALS